MCKLAAIDNRKLKRKTSGYVRFSASILVTGAVAYLSEVILENGWSLIHSCATNQIL